MCGELMGSGVWDELLYGDSANCKVVYGETSDKIFRRHSLIICRYGKTYMVFITINTALSGEVHLCATVQALKISAVRLHGA